MPYEPTPVKFYKLLQPSGQYSYQVMPWMGNQPFGYEEVSEAEYQQATGDTRQHTSPYTMINGIPMLISQAEEQQRMTGDLSGMVNIGTPDRPMYVPRGSAGYEAGYENLTAAGRIPSTAAAQTITTPTTAAPQATVTQAITPSDMRQARQALQTQGITSPTIAQIRQKAVEMGLALARPGTSTGIQAGTQGVTVLPDNLQRAHDIINNSGLDEGTKTLFNQTVDQWPVGTPINIQAILQEFNRIKTETIDPYFAEQIRLYTDDLTNAVAQQQQARPRELETENIEARRNVQAAQQSLESRGMTFTGEAAQQLGAQSAFGGQLQYGAALPEGLVPTSNRLISSSSQARYQQALRDLQRQGEARLGSTGVTNNIPGVEPLGGIIGSVERERPQAYGSALSGIAGQARQNYQYQEPLRFNFS